MESDEKKFQSTDNSSFVIIDKISAESKKQIEITDNMLKRDTLRDTALNAIIDQFNSESALKNPPLAEEIERTVIELLKENAKLKETLQQNNTFMKNQLSRFAKLQEEVCKIQQPHKAKFEETMEMILKLKTENQELKKQNTETVRSMGHPVDNKTSEKFIKNQTKFEKSKASQQKLCNDPKCAAFKAEVFNENRTLKEKLLMNQEKLYEFNQQLAMSSRSDKEQELIQVITDLSKQVENAERCKRKLNLELERLRAQEMKLQIILSTGDSRNVTDECYWNAVFPSVSVATRFEAQLIENLKRFEQLLNTDQNFLNEPVETQQSSSDTSWVNINSNNDEQTLQIVKSDVAVCYKLLAREQAISNCRKELLDNARIKFNEILKQCLTILKQHDSKIKAHEIEGVRMREKLKEVDSLRHELSDKHNRIIQLEREHSIMENMIDKKSQEIEQKDENLSLLQDQMKIYEEDFNSEREAREELANKKNLLEQRLNSLQQQNDMLSMELKRPLKDGVEKNKKDSFEKSKPRKQFACFNDTCSESFASEDDLQQHVYSCLNIKD